MSTTADIYAHLDYSSKISSANTISNALAFDDKNENIDDEIAALEKLLEEKKKFKKKKNFEM